MSTPRIIYDGDEAAAHRHLPVAQNLLHKVRTMAAASGAGTTGLSLSPDPDSFIYVLKIDSIEVVHIYSAPQTSYEPKVYAYESLPDFLSGVTKEARITERTVKGPNGEERKIKTLDSFKPNTETSKRYKRSGFSLWDRLAVKPHPSILGQGVFDWVSQYRVIFPTSYSGRMCKLVQVLLGYGRIGGGQTAGSVQEKEDVAANGLRVQYDYRWHHTHILVTAEDKRLWLVEISINRGVVAMLLPVYPKKPVADSDAIKTVLEEFKGLPTGQSFPTGKAFKAAVKAGTILQLATSADLAPFYRMLPFSSAMGWTTNTLGSEAHNTGWYWDETGVRNAAHYRLQIHIGALKKDPDPEEPIADGSAVLTKVSSGKFYHPNKRFPPPIKFYEPLIDGLQSVDMSVTDDREGKPETSPAAIPLCDVTMHVCFINDELKLVNYFWDRRRNSGTTVDTNFEPCMYIGAWYREEVTPLSDFVPTFYTTDFDDRTPGADYIVREDVVGSDMGRWSHYWTADSSIPVFPQWGFLWRERTFRIRSVTVRTEAAYNAAAIVVPRGLRDGYVYALYHNKGTVTTTSSTNYKTLTDPTSYQTYKYFYESYKPKEGCWLRYQYKVRLELGPVMGFCNDIISEGSWKEPCDDAQPLMGPEPPKNTESTKTTDPFSMVTPHLVTGSERGIITLPSTSGADFSESRWDKWRVRSPDPDFGFIQTYDAMYSVLGQPHLAYYNIIDGTQTRIGPLIADSQQSVFNFLGVL